ncbi:MAG: asparagine synthase (glutamine-hydrolyzing) [Syntrophobacterales bacterium]|jgi:asparagine synthase (glutamine-hydrolysing)
MCGLCGFRIARESSIVNHKRLLRDMTDVLAHRGPDSEGYYYVDERKERVGLGHRRLSVIDLSDNANQPMGNEDDSIIVVFNGEIYNYKQLTNELTKKGHTFRSHSDTEVILHLYEDLEDDCVNKLDGMFAFAVWDKERDRFLLARDRLGIKPLYYVFKNNNFYFASEIKALLAVDDVSREIDFKALDYYFTYGYIPDSCTIFKDIKKLPPSSYLVFENRQIHITSYWAIRYLPKHQLSETELIETLHSEFIEAIERHLVSDVPVGAFLSGGVDSSIVVALMDKVKTEAIETFSLGYESGGKDELHYASSVADRLGTNHHEFRVAPNMTKVLPKLLWQLDEPFFDNSIIPTYYISKMARAKTKVVLSGDGGDEIFGGYEWARRNQYKTVFNMIPGFIQNSFAKFSTHLQPEDFYSRKLAARACRFFSDLTTDTETGFLRRTSVSQPFRQMLYSQALRDELRDFDAAEYRRQLFSAAQVMDDRERMLHVDTMSFLPDDCLYKVDRMSMAHGLEVRVPFLDKKIVEFAARIPFEYKIRGLTSKYILKKTFARYLPKEILKQRKQGFTIPISAWLRDELGNMAFKILMSKSVEKRDLFEKKQLQWMLEEHRRGKQELGHRIWSLVVFEIWARLYLDEKIGSPPEISLQEMAA